MPKSVDHIDGRTAVSDIISYQNGNYIPISFFFIICLTLKSFLTDFEFFFFFFFNENSLPLSFCLKLPLAGTYAKRKPYRCYISQTR